MGSSSGRSSFRKWTRPILFRSIVALIRGGDSILGPGFVSLLLYPLIAGDFLRRLADYAQFKKLRNTLPASFWKSPPLRHYFCMIRTWQESLAFALVYDRLSLPRWMERIKFSGTSPDQLPDWGQRPVIVVFLHTGGFGILRSCLRARGVPAASFLRTLPAILESHAQEIRAAGDAHYGFSSLPHFFLEGDSLRPAIRFLIPGHVLTMALDGASGATNLVPCDINGQAIHLRDGAVRIAQIANAMLLPVSVHRRGACRFELHFGRAVPDDLMSEDKTKDALQYLARELWLDLENDPTAIGWSTLEALAPDQASDRMAWP